MDIQAIAAIVFVVILTIYLISIRKRLDIQKILFPFLYLILYRSEFGLKFMKKIARKYPKTVRFFGAAGVVVGFLGMILISGQLIYVLFEMFTTPDAPPGVAPVLPIDAPGVVYVPFFFWIISIFVIATVHEFAHGIVSNYHKVPVRTSGFAFFGIILPVIPAAFVEPDEKLLAKKSAKKQLSVFAAGPFSNIVLAFIVLGLIAAVVNPLASAAFINDGVAVSNILEDTAAHGSDLDVNEIIVQVDEDEIDTVERFTEVLSDKKAGETITLITNTDSHEIELGEHTDDPEKGFLGVNVMQSTSKDAGFVEKYGEISVNVIDWTSELFFWLFLLNLGIGLFNLLPLGIVDGGRMLQLGLVAMAKTKKGKSRAQNIWKYTSMFFLFIVLFMIIAAFL
ncbi:MAG: site-2 protease family protein [Candidatus Woesearchaeota archaeon]